MSQHSKKQEIAPALQVRIDKWLWAARFFKTRSLARQAVEGGAVKCNGDRVKPCKTVKEGETLWLRQGYAEKTVIVKALSDKRKGAAEAARLYEETPESIAKREKAAEERKLLNAGNARSPRPNKRDRRLIERFKKQFFNGDGF